MTIFYKNSRDRSCPMCQTLSNELWIDAQREGVLDIDYYHLVFTCPTELNPLIYANQKEFYSLFFYAVADTVMELSGNPAHLGGTPGFISIMHTWGSDLSDHIHILCTGGGLDADRNRHQKKDGFFLSGKAMAAHFKGKSCLDPKHCIKQEALAMKKPQPNTAMHINIRNCWLPAMGKTGSRTSGSPLSGRKP